MSKHAHADLINKWLDDTSQEVRILDAGIAADYWRVSTIAKLICDNEGRNYFRVIQKVDPYAELKQAQADGKRIVWLDAEGDWLDVDESTKWKFNYPPDRYKIIPYDQTEQISKFTNKFGIVVLKLTRSEITGKLTAEVI
jgi:hypothetical protein